MNAIIHDFTQNPQGVVTMTSTAKTPGSVFFVAEPLSRSLNVAILSIAGRLFPTGFDTALTGAPDTLEKLNAHIERTGRMLVYSGHSDATIFDCENVNHAFRAWHDWCHWKGQFAFDAQGEKQAFEMQCDHLRKVYGEDHPELSHWVAILDAEINGQVQHSAVHGHFPHDQKAFVKAWLEHPSATYYTAY